MLLWHLGYSVRPGAWTIQYGGAVAAWLCAMLSHRMLCGVGGF